MTQKWIYNGVEFKSGDEVEVIDVAVDREENGMGAGVHWDNIWMPEMNDAIFHKFTIAHIQKEGVQFDEVEGETDYSYGYLFPLSVLRKVKQ